jgi:hypothetical protein
MASFRNSSETSGFIKGEKIPLLIDYYRFKDVSILRTSFDIGEKI